MLRGAKIDKEAKTLKLILDLQEPTPSASGKTLVIATTHGNVTMQDSAPAPMRSHQKSQP